MSEEMEVKEALQWFEKNVSSILSGPRQSILKHMNKIMHLIEDLIETSARFDYSDIKDPTVYQNYATTIYKKTEDLFSKITIPEDVNYNAASKFLDSCKNQITAYINVLAKYLSWLKRDRSFKSKVKALDRSLSRLQKEVNAFELKTLTNYGEMIDYERVIENLNRVIELLNEKKLIQEEIASYQEDVDKLTNIITQKEKELNELVSHPGFKKLEENKKELESIEIAISNKVSEIKKLCNKILKAAESRKLSLNDTEKEAMKSLVKDPFAVITSDSDGYHSLKGILSKLRDISRNPVIQMKKDKLEKALANIDEIINDGLLEEQKRAKFLLQQSAAIENKFKELEIDRKIKKLKREVENLKIDRERITLPLRRKLKEVNEEINNLIKSSEEKIEQLLGKSLKIKIPEEE